MKTLSTKSRKISVLFGDALHSLKLMPMTYRKLEDINMALGDDKDLSSVLQNPSSYDLSIIACCLLDDESKAVVNDARLQINEEDFKTNPAHKLFYLMSENNISDGLTNYTSILQGVTSLVSDSIEAPTVKKKILSHLFHWMFARFTTKSDQITHINTTSS